MRLIEYPDGAVTALAYAPDGSMLATGHSAGTVHLWHPLGGTPLRTCRLDPCMAAVASLAFSPDGQRLAVGLFGPQVQLWLVGSGRIERTLTPDHTGHSQRLALPSFVAFTWQGDRLAVAHYMQVTEYEPSSGAILRKSTLPTYFPERPLTAVAYRRDDVLLAGAFNTLARWSTPQRNMAINWPSGDVVCIRGSPDGRTVAACRGRDVGLWEYTQNREPVNSRPQHVVRHSDNVRACVFTPDGRTLLTAGDDWAVHLWDVATRQKRTSFNWRLGPIQGLAIAPDGMTVAAFGRDQQAVLIWDLE